MRIATSDLSRFASFTRQHMVVASHSSPVLEIPQHPSHKLLQLFRWMRDPFPFLEECMERYGELFTLRMPALGDAVMVAHPGIIRDVFQAGDEIALGEENTVLEPIVGSRSLLLMTGEGHRIRRKRLLPSFQGRCLRGVAGQVKEIVSRRLSAWEGRTIDVRAEMESLTLEVILAMVFGRDVADEFPAVAKEINRLLSFTASPSRSLVLFLPALRTPMYGLSPGDRLAAVRRSVDMHLKRIMDARRSGSSETLLSLLLEMRTEDGAPLCEEELLDQVKTLLVAGHETTATVLTWAFHWLTIKRDWSERLREDEGGTLLDAFLNETLRIYPIGPIVFTRVVRGEFRTNGYTFPEGTVIAPCVYLAHHREQSFPDSHQFRPERFLERDIGPFEFFPFGGGERRCLGAPLAMLEMREVVREAVRRYALTRVSSGTPVPRRRGITLAPHPALELRCTAHS
jgi:cytochrome P450 family 110